MENMIKVFLWQRKQKHEIFSVRFACYKCIIKRERDGEGERTNFSFSFT